MAVELAADRIEDMTRCLDDVEPTASGALSSSFVFVWQCMRASNTCFDLHVLFPDVCIVDVKAMITSCSAMLASRLLRKQLIVTCSALRVCPTQLIPQCE